MPSTQGLKQRYIIRLILGGITIVYLRRLLLLYSVLGVESTSWQILLAHSINIIVVAMLAVYPPQMAPLRISLFQCVLLTTAVSATVFLNRQSILHVDRSIEEQLYHRDGKSQHVVFGTEKQGSTKSLTFYFFEEIENGESARIRIRQGFDEQNTLRKWVEIRRNDTFEEMAANALCIRYVGGKWYEGAISFRLDDVERTFRLKGLYPDICDCGPHN